jgi:hypothetical protein
MKLWQLSDGIRLHHQPHHGHDGDGVPALGQPDLAHRPMIDTGDDSAGDGGGGLFSGVAINSPVAFFNPVNTTCAPAPGHADAYQSNDVQIDQHAVQMAGIGGAGGNDNLAMGGNISAVAPASGSGVAAPGPGAIDSGGNTAGNGGDGYFYGGIIHASMVVYEPINISVAAGYDSTALADQTNNASFNQSALQMAGIGGNGGDGNIAAGGSAALSSPAAASELIATGGNGAGNGGSGTFAGTLVDAPIVIYHPMNFAIAGPGGTADASQANTVAIDQSAVQIAGIGGNAGSGNAAIGGNVTLSGYGSPSGGWQIESGGELAGNGGDGSFHGSLVHTSVVVYDPVNIAVAGYNSTTEAYQTNNVTLDQSSSQTAGVGGNGGSGNVAMGGNAGITSSGLGSGSDVIATGGNGAGNGGSGHFSGSIIDVSVAIYAPINIAIAGPHATAEADQVNNVHIDQSATQIAGIGGDGGNGNLALGGDVAAHLLSDLHLVA